LNRYWLNLNNCNAMKMNRQELEAAEILVDLAIREDVGTGDVTTDNLVPTEWRKKAELSAKAGGVIAGLEVARMVYFRFGQELVWQPLVEDGDRVSKGDVLVRFEAGYRTLLTGERTALNFLQRMSGIATAASRFREILSGSRTRILDTRKTLPGFRLLDKYAVRAGGGVNHRNGLYDMVMIKDNHIAVAGGISRALSTIREKVPGTMKIEVETTNLQEVEEALMAGADIIMLDNMDLRMMEQAVKLIGGRARTEASGNMTEARVAEVAATGVDFISVGALTHSVTALDISQTIYP
jgi:nicotinate-nucleotide pyrophosphorylase (carboxylating)